MSFTNTNGYLTGVLPLPTPQGSEVVATRFAIDLVAADLGANDIGAIGALPSGCVPVALFVDADKLDSGTALQVSVGVLNDAGTDLSAATEDGGAVWGAGIKAGQTGTQEQVLSRALSRVAAKNVDRKIGVKVTTAAATAVPGELGLTLLYRAA